MPRTLAELNTFRVHLLHEGEDYKLGVLLHDLDKADHTPVACTCVAFSRAEQLTDLLLCHRSLARQAPPHPAHISTC